MASATTAEQLAKAREAAVRNDWGLVDRWLTEVDHDSLTATDLELHADASWWLQRLDDSLGLRQRAYAAFLEERADRRASFCAWMLWLDYRFKGDAAISSGWLIRAERHVADDTECAEAGFAALARALEALESGRLDDAEPLIREALDLGHHLRSPDLVALATTDLGRVLLATGRVPEGVALLDDAMCSVIAGELSAFFTGLVYCDVLGGCFDIADLRRAGEWSAAAMAWCESLPSGSPYHAVCRVHRVEVSTLRGAWAHAEAEGLRASEDLFVLQPAAAAEAFFVVGEIRRRRGDLAGAEEALVRAHDLGRSPQPVLALVRLAQSRLDDAVALLRVSRDELPAAPLPRAVFLGAQVEIALATGDHEEAARPCAALEELAPAIDGSTVVGGIAALARARVALAADHVDEARECATEASRAFRELDVPYEAALARGVLGEALRRAGDADGGRIELEAARRALAELGATVDAERVAAMAMASGDHRPRGLTAREIEVLQLVAAGKSNREIAAEMYLSEHTVGRHLQNIFAKLDVSSRVAATAFAYEHALV